MRILLALFVLPTFVWSTIGVTSLPARDIFVNNLTGDDHRSGTSTDLTSPESGPVRSLQRALRLAHFGDRVILAKTAEPYSEYVSLEGPENSGTEITPFVLEGNGAVLDGSLPVPVDAWRPVAADVLAFRPPRISYCLLFVDGQPATRQTALYTGQLSRLEPKQWCLASQQMLFRVEQDRVPSDYALSYTAYPVGLTLYGVRHVVIRNLTVQGFRLDGVNAHDNAFEVQLVALTCRANGRSGVSVGGASRVSLQQCRLRDNATAQLRTEGWSHTQVVQSELPDGPGQAWTMDGGQLTIDGQQQP